jgi:CheY-like chemotaxis protein
MGGILIVEDCADTRRLIERALSGQFALRHADDLASARTALSESRPELVLLDIGLPDGDGMALCSGCAATTTMRAVPVIFLSSRNAPSTPRSPRSARRRRLRRQAVQRGRAARARVGAAAPQRSLEKDSALRVLGRCASTADRFKAHRGRGRRRARSRSHRPRAALLARSPRRPAACSRAPSSRACWSATA